MEMDFYFGIFVGVIISLIIFLFIVNIWDIEKVNQTKKRDIRRYHECKIEEGWVDMLEISRELISIDGKIFKYIAELIEKFPSMTPGQLHNEFKHLHDVSQLLLVYASQRSTESDTINGVVTRDKKLINDEIAKIEQQWPDEIKKEMEAYNSFRNNTNQ